MYLIVYKFPYIKWNLIAYLNKFDKYQNLIIIKFKHWINKK